MIPTDGDTKRIEPVCHGSVVVIAVDGFPGPMG